MLSSLSDSLYRTESNLFNLLFRKTGTLLLLVAVSSALTLAGALVVTTAAQNLLYAIIVTSLLVGIITFFLLNHFDPSRQALDEDEAGWHWLDY
jgi:hypothetical protein